MSPYDFKCMQCDFIVTQTTGCRHYDPKNAGWYHCVVKHKKTVTCELVWFDGYAWDTFKRIINWRVND